MKKSDAKPNAHIRGGKEREQAVDNYLELTKKTIRRRKTTTIAIAMKLTHVYCEMLKPLGR